MQNYDRRHLKFVFVFNDDKYFAYIKKAIQTDS